MITHIIITTAASPNTMLDQNTDIMYVYGIINKYNVFFGSLFDGNGDFFVVVKNFLSSCLVVLLSFFIIFAKNIFYDSDFIAFILFYITSFDNLSL